MSYFTLPNTCLPPYDLHAELPDFSCGKHARPYSPRRWGKGEVGWVRADLALAHVLQHGHCWLRIAVMLWTLLFKKYQTP